MSKTAILGMTKTLAKELSIDKIRVNCIAPGWCNLYFCFVFLILRHNDQATTNIKKKDTKIKQKNSV